MLPDFAGLFDFYSVDGLLDKILTLPNLLAQLKELIGDQRIDLSVTKNMSVLQTPFIDFFFTTLNSYRNGKGEKN